VSQGLKVKVRHNWFYNLSHALLSQWDREQESRAVARKPRDAAAVLFGLKFADDIHYKFKNSQASKAKLQSSKQAQNKIYRKMAVQGHPRSLISLLMESAYVSSCWSSMVTLVLSCPLSEILQCFFLLRTSTPPLFHPNLEMFPLDKIADTVAAGA